ncbi:hypothetical protein Ddye_026007 [Dipteronia dyeriana]|uniref:Zinc knuckle CX2CX4HX4C domain-containing protein n=1 Tax=Dipteronia dyeriana TaxID=168575 RepID=A0AAD9TLE7_9ROSI|nr:hypothetical protein Ddye_026007 [Dipteronia dyeriana]
MAKEIGQVLRSMVKVMKDVDVGSSGECSGEFLRARVFVDITKPLRRCLHIDILGDGEETVMLLRYERLPNHSFRCGRLGNPSQECVNWNWPDEQLFSPMNNSIGLGCGLRHWKRSGIGEANSSQVKG